MQTETEPSIISQVPQESMKDFIDGRGPLYEIHCDLVHTSTILVNLSAQNVSKQLWLPDLASRV